MKTRGSNGQFQKTNKPRRCRHCKTLFNPISDPAKFCDWHCYSEWQKNRPTKQAHEYQKTRTRGYLQIRDTEVGRAVFEHRKIMETHIGRKLRRGEVVHHINGKRDDNRIENLQLFANNSLHTHHHATNEPCRRCFRPLNIDGLKHAGRGLCKPCYLVGFRLAKKGRPADWW